MNLAISANGFPHRLNADGTYDAICPRCFRTVATCKIEADLDLEERSHRCQDFPLTELRERLLEAAHQ